MNEPLAYLKERWAALIEGQPAHLHQIMWGIYTGGIAVGIAAAKDATREQILACVDWLGRPEPPTEESV